MSKRLDYTLTDEQLKGLETTITSSPHPEVRQRVIALRLLHQGQSLEAVAAVGLVTVNTRYAWHKRWREHGLDGLQDRKRTGRPAKADQRYRDQLARLLEVDPHTLGLPFTIWTIHRLRLYLAETTGIVLSYTRFRSLLRREGYRWNAPKHDLSHRPPGPGNGSRGAGLVEKNIPLNPIAQTERLFMDETTVSLHPPLRR